VQNRLLILAVACAVVTLGGCECQKKGIPADWVAKVTATSGTVKLRTAAGESVRPAKVADYMRVGGVMTTGKNGRATLTLRNGGQLAVKPNTTLSLSSDKPASQVDLKLLSGSVESTAPNVAASELVINVGGRRVRLGKSAKATVSLPEGSVSGAAVVVNFGTASVERQGSAARKVVAGETFALTLPGAKPKAPKPDAGAAGDTGVTATPIVFYLQNRGRGRVLYRLPGERGFKRLRGRRAIAIKPGTELKLARRAKVQVGPEKGKGMSLKGPAQLVVRASDTADDKGKYAVRVESKAGELSIRDRGKPGKRGNKLVVDGVSIATRVTWKRIDVEVKRDGGRAVVVVHRGVALLTDSGGKVTRVEAGQRARIKAGSVSGPTQPSPARLQIKRPGSMRVFTASRRLPVTLRWDRGQGDVLVEVSRNRAFRGPLFADVIKRDVLTLPGVPRGALYWRVRPISDGSLGKGTRGSLSLLVDTSHRVLKSKPPKNTITPTNTRVYYQNALPRFTFDWKRIPGAVRYQFKIYRETNLSRPLVKKDTRRTRFRLRRPLSEGRYLWYVSGRDRRGKVLRGMSGRTLTIRYDNATPNLQIIYPRNGLAVSKATLEVRGIAIRGSRVFVNGTAASLDDAYRFRHTVSLKPGDNKIVFRVEDKRRGSSVYLRYVTRR
jgi:hypothetical protein